MESSKSRCWYWCCGADAVRSEVSGIATAETTAVCRAAPTAIMESIFMTLCCVCDYAEKSKYENAMG